MVLSAAALVAVLAFVVFTVDLGFLLLTKTQMASAADAAVLAAGLEMTDGLGLDATQTEPSVEALGQQAANEVAALHRSGDLISAYVDGPRDVRFGKREWDSSTASWNETWDVGPYNLVEVTVHRDQEYAQAGSGVTSPPGDEAVPLFFGPIIGHSTAKVTTSAAAAYLPGVGFEISAGSSETAMVLPIAYDLPSWDAMLAGSGNDDYAYDSNTGQVTSGSDGLLEINIYPDAAPPGSGGSSQWTPGNRGTVDFGDPNNSTADLSRQIVNGLDATDLSYFNGELSFASGPLDVNGDTGISAGIKDDLEAIIGQPRAIPLFTDVVDPGNNATFTLVKFVAIQILDVNLTGANKYVIAQPATLIDSTVVSGDAIVEESSIFTNLKLIR